MSRAAKEQWAKCAAVSVRRSTEHQQYSTSNQMDVIREYARKLGFTIVKEYSDQGKSGLNMEGRESLVVFPQKGQPGKYMLVNGHMRHCAMKELGVTAADCIIANEDEGFTYNARISRLPAIQEHKMISRAVKNGASLERIAAALNITPKGVQASLNLLTGISHEAVELLKDKPIPPKSLRLLKKVTGERQVEIARLMIDANNYHAGYAEGLVLVTRKELLVAADQPKKKKGMTAESIAKMEQEMVSLESGMKAITENYKENMFTLQTAHTYIKALLKNRKVVKYLKAKHAEIATEFHNLAAAEAV